MDLNYQDANEQALAFIRELPFPTFEDVFTELPVTKAGYPRNGAPGADKCRHQSMGRQRGGGEEGARGLVQFKGQRGWVDAWCLCERVDAMLMSP